MTVNVSTQATSNAKEPFYDVLIAHEGHVFTVPAVSKDAAYKMADTIYKTIFKNGRIHISKLY